MDLRVIPAGRFSMGYRESEELIFPGNAPHWVMLSRDFALGTAPVTNHAYRWFLENAEASSATRRDDLARIREEMESRDGAELPVGGVSWHEATAFCGFLRDMTGKPYRLPTEAEWEYACRAGTDSQFFFGDDATAAERYVWVGKNGEGRRHPVARKLPNPWGLYDMLGNVYEWCHDWFGELPGEDAVDPTGPSENVWGSGDEVYKVARGGSYAGLVPCSFRLDLPPTHKSDILGFRVAMDVA